MYTTNYTGLNETRKVKALCFKTRMADYLTDYSLI